MEKQEKNQSSRRQFVTKSIPACALSVFVLSQLKSVISSEINQPTLDVAMPQDKHKFDLERKFPKPLSFREFNRTQNLKFIQLCKSLIEDLGEEEALQIIKNYTTKTWLKYGQEGAKRNSDNSFKSYINIFRQPSMLNILNMEIIEDTDKVFEIKVSECLPCEIYKAEGFDGKFGFACVCHGDYAWAEGYNPKIKLIRDKTLMEGHSYCNHRYVFEG